MSKIIMINVDNITISEKYFVISWKRKVLKKFQVQKFDTVVYSLQCTVTRDRCPTSLRHPGTALAVSVDPASPFAGWHSNVSHSQVTPNWLDIVQGCNILYKETYSPFDYSGKAFIQFI